ncbi:hypothetical protein [Metabacillus sp. FJAT-52054]|uniref:PspA/IM30 family protein n=1 Tax=Metabacillus sediminis TaxID=3117746 RepID=A0ABZ2NJD5_9BACI
MGLFNANTLKKVKATAEKFEAKKAELEEKRTALIEEKHVLRSELENDFQRQIMEGTNPDKKLQTDYDKTVAELERVTLQLSSIDGIKAKELAKFTEEVQKERKAFIEDADKKLNEVRGELFTLKAKYLQALVKHQETRTELSREFIIKFRDVEEVMEIERVDFRYRSVLQDSFNVDPRDFNPMINNFELREGLQGKLTANTKKALEK